MADGDNSWSGSEEEQSGPGGRLGDGYETTAGSSGHTGAESGPHPTTEFRACYLLTSLSETAGGQTYIGYTNDPRRRLRQLRRLLHTLPHLPPCRVPSHKGRLRLSTALLARTLRKPA